MNAERRFTEGAAVESDDALRAALRAAWTDRSGTGPGSEGIYLTLRECILNGVLGPGVRLTEGQLAELFFVSRTPIREAIFRLETEGLVSRGGRRGIVISSITPEEVFEVYEVRETLDGLAAYLAATRINQPTLAKMKWLNQRMVNAGAEQNFEEMARLNLQFHEALAKASANTFLLQQIRLVLDRVQRFPGTTFSYGSRWKEAVGEHDGIMDAIEAGDAETARVRAMQHMARARDVRLESLWT